MTKGDVPGQSAGTRIVTCDVAFCVSEPAEVVVQVTAARSAGPVEDARFEVLTDGEPPVSVEELVDRQGQTMHVIGSAPGQLTVRYRARIGSPAGPSPGDETDGDGTDGAGGTEGRASSSYGRQVYLRPSRYCPSDHLVGFAVAEFGAGERAGARVGAIAEWIRRRTGYVPGSSDVHDSAEDTLLTGVGTCRDFAHLGIALCRATGVPARFAAVYAPGLSPMDFHAVFEAFHDGRWTVYDPTGLAPRQSLVRVVTGRDAADTAFAAVTDGLAELELVEVSATVEPSLPVDDHSRIVALA